MVPVSLLMVWIFISTTIFVNEMVSTANNFGLLGSAATLLSSNPSGSASWTAALGQFGLLNGSSLQWAEMTESFSRNVIPLFIWQVAIALLYLTWIAIWWAHHTREVSGQLLEG